MSRVEATELQGVDDLFNAQKDLLSFLSSFRPWIQAAFLSSDRQPAASDK